MANLHAQSLPEPPQWEVGLELGGAISAMVPSSPSIPSYQQRLGWRAGVYVQRNLPANFALRSGLLYTLRGIYYDPAQFPQIPVRYWDIHGVNAPLMVVYHLDARIDVALGIECNMIVDSNRDLLRLPSFLFGPRGSVGFQWSPRLQVSAYYTHILNRLLVLPSPPGEPDYYYNNIVSGICIAYRLTANSVEKAPPLPDPSCPRY